MDIASVDGKRGVVSNNTVNVHESCNIGRVFTFSIMGNLSDVKRERDGRSFFRREVCLNL